MRLREWSFEVCKELVIKDNPNLEIEYWSVLKTLNLPDKLKTG
ncbi:13346_t:CDS:2 [Gigaspora margarita]|uniref:13346_t:CDS:1 n=1 Tax=Gigaspora margarita TaxID=4874 RepID=A0ABN7V791_GIGMA|nr:13346_t:CDS:2 [Gigaspora margarita]